MPHEHPVVVEGGWGPAGMEHGRMVLEEVLEGLQVARISLRREEEGGREGREGGRKGGRRGREGEKKRGRDRKGGRERKDRGGGRAEKGEREEGMRGSMQNNYPKLHVCTLHAYSSCRLEVTKQQTCMNPYEHLMAI